MNFSKFYFNEHVMLDNPNFVKWFKGSKVVDYNGNPLRLYHETDAKNVGGIQKTGFDISKVGARSGEDTLPDGIYMKPQGGQLGIGGVDANTVQIPLYANIKKPLYVKDRDKMRSYLMKNSEYNDIISELKVYNAEMKEKVDSLYKGLVRSQLGEYRKKSRELLDEWGKNADMLYAEARRVVTDILKRDGYDGVIIDKDDGSFGRSTMSFIAFSPNQVKSAIGNVGTFNPDSNNVRETNIDEDVNDDRRLRNHAETVFEKIVQQLATKKNLIHNADGTFALNGKTLGFGVSDLWFLFVPKNSIESNANKFRDKEASEISGGFGTTRDKVKVIVIPILKALGDDSNIEYNFKLYLHTFVHEFTHYKTYKKHDGKEVMKADSEADYYNNSDENYAYYQEALHKYKNTMNKFTVFYRKLIKQNNTEKAKEIMDLIKTYIPDDFVEFVKFMFQYYFDRQFIKNLDEKNMKRLKRRLYQYYEYLLEMGDDIVNEM